MEKKINKTTFPSRSREDEILSEALAIQEIAIRRARDLMKIEIVSGDIYAFTTSCEIVSSNKKCSGIKVSFKSHYSDRIIKIFIIIEDIEKTDEEWDSFFNKISQENEKKKNREKYKHEYDKKIMQLKQLKAEIEIMEKDLHGGSAAPTV